MGRLRLRRAQVGAEAVADGCDVQLGPVLREARQGRDQRNVEAGLLLRHDQGRLHRHRSVRPEGHGEDEGGHRREAQAIVSGKFNVFTGPLYDQKGKVAVPAGKTLKVLPGPVLDAVARQGRHREDLRRSRLRASQVGEPVPASVVSERGAGSAGASPPSAVRMTGITKRFPGVVANDGVSFEAAAGEVHALLGENGAGKTTLSNILTGLYRPDEGEIELYGEPVRFQSPRDALDAGICMVHQHFRLVEPFSVAENVVLGDHRGEGRRLVLHTSATEQRVDELSHRYGLAVNPKAKIWQLSIGEQQRVEILKALYRDAKILILDEPTAVLTPQEAEMLFVTLRSMVDEGKTVIFISHKLHEVKAVADRVTVLRGGRTVATVDAGPSTPRSLAALMVGREIDIHRGWTRERPPGEEVVLAVEGVTVPDDRGGNALQDVSLEIRSGEILALQEWPGTVSASWPRRSPACARTRRARSVSAAIACDPAIREQRSPRESPTCPRTASAPGWRRA